MPEETPSAKGPTLHVITTLEVVGYNETRQIDKVMDPSSPDRVLYLAPVSGTTKSVIDVRTTDGRILRIPVDTDTMVAIFDTTELRERCQRAIEELKESQ
jgi:fibrillarin-like rRNA methylase